MMLQILLLNGIQCILLFLANVLVMQVLYTKIKTVYTVYKLYCMMLK